MYRTRAVGRRSRRGGVNDVPNPAGAKWGGVNDVPSRRAVRRRPRGGEGRGPAALIGSAADHGAGLCPAPRAGAHVKAERERSTESARAAGGGDVNEVPSQAASVASSSGATRERGQNAIRMRSLLAQRRVSTPSSSSNSRACGSKLIVI